MSKWILLHDVNDGRLISVNVNHISAMDTQDDGGSLITFEKKNITKVKVNKVKESLSEIMRKVADA
jgi:hypothetical protein